MGKVNIMHLSDSHNFYDQYMIGDNVDVVVFTGDAECYYREDFFNFLKWYSQVPVKDKIYVAGNHDLFIERNEIICRQLFEENGIIYLNKNSVTLHGLKFYGDPMVPRFGIWSFMADRSKMNKHWEYIPADVDVLLTHTPPKGILDLSTSRDGTLEMCGCSALAKRIKTYQNLKLHCFGHIHNRTSDSIVNHGTRTIDGVIFSNATGVEDGKRYDGLVNQGNLIEINI